MIKRITTTGGSARYHEIAVQDAIDKIQSGGDLEVTKVTRVSKEGIIFGADVTEIEYYEKSRIKR